MTNRRFNLLCFVVTHFFQSVNFKIMNSFCPRRKEKKSLSTANLLKTTKFFLVFNLSASTVGSQHTMYDVLYTILMRHSATTQHNQSKPLFYQNPVFSAQ